ncbi:MAG: hypothetical protein K2N60_08220 [Oscillospiraceae bacterium]|nr:hypothetical protein [Oscillospiraceae bacterium]
MIWVFFILAWLISPLVLLPLYFSKRSECNRLAKQNRELIEQLNKLQRESSETDPAQASEQPPQTPENQAYDPNPYLESQPYNLPQYNIPNAPIRNLSPAPEKPKPIFNGKAETAYAPPPAAVGETPKKSVSTINIILILGALLISLSGFIFAVATWGVLNTFFKSVVLISFSAIFFAIHSVSERKLKLPQTGRVFYILGSIFLPSAVVAAGILKVFGEYFSFTGDGRAAVLAVIFLTVCIPFFKGAQDYKNRFFAAVSFYTFSAAAVSLIWQVSPNGSIVALAASVFALAIAILEPTAQKLFGRLFGEDNVFSAEFSRFSAVNAWALSIVSLFAAESGFVSLAAFAIFSVCFLTKTVTDKGSTAGAIAFAFFITTSMFIGFEPGDFSEMICIIAATALICGVLSVMGIFPEALKKALNILGIASAGITGFCAFLENTILFSSLEAPSPALVIALAAVFAELLIFALRYKTAYYKAMSFGAMLLLSSTALQLIFGDAYFGNYTPFFSYEIVLAYFCVTRFTRLKDKLYTSANDIISAAYALWCAMILTLNNMYTIQNYVLSLVILALGAACAAVSNHKKFSPVICPILTFTAVFPISDIFDRYNFYPFADETAVSALAVIIILICVIGTLLLFIKRAEKYAKAYGITIAASLPIFTIACLAESNSDFIPIAAITVYTAVYLFKIAFPKEKYVQIHLLHVMILLTMIFVGVRYADPEIVMCFPSVAALMMFAVNIAGTAFGCFEKTSKHTEHFLWYAMPALSGILLWTSREEGLVPMMIFGIVLAVCALLLSIFRRNTLPLIFPVLAGLMIISDAADPVPSLIFAVIFAAFGHVLFRKKLWEKYYFDIFSIAAFLSAAIAFSQSFSDNWKWVSLLMFALLTVNLMRGGQSSKTNRTILTAAAAFLFPLWWTVPFFTVPDLIAVQFNLLPVIIFCVILRFIWHDALPAVYNFAFISAIVSLIVLFIDAMASGNNFDSIFIGVVLFIMLAVSFIIKKKRWFVLAVASMVVSAVLLSISRLDSIAWLVYLLIAGAALIALGVLNELKKQQKKSGDDTKLTRFMSDWKW